MPLPVGADMVMHSQVVPDENAYGTEVADRDRLAHVVHVLSALGSLMSELLVSRPKLAYAVGAFAVGVVNRAMTDTGIVHSGALQSFSAEMPLPVGADMVMHSQVVPDENAYGTEVADRDRLAHVVHVLSALGSLMSELLVSRPKLAYAVGAFAVGVVNRAMTDTGIVHSGALQEITSRKILQAGFVWPSLHRDVQHWCKACKACQQAGDRKLSYGPRFPIFAYGPFEKWGIDAIGPLPRTSTGKQYILTATDYMTRWAEAASVVRITAADVSKFVLDYICCRFDTPLEILSDRSPGFRADLLDALLENLSIKHVHSTPYYPQCNGLVEKTNGVLCKIITKHVRDRPQDWDKHLTAALWAYRTSFKVSTQFTPYHLVYGQEALLPIEIELGSLRVLARETTSSKEKLEQRILDLQRLELDREAATDYYITQANKKREQFNNKIKENGKITMLVLHGVSEGHGP
ncbi:hypothetical protein L7F22_000240 [Adiantum nelumboides]|nr:hypothetical protein [Adiantum nelumboides]